MCHSLVLYIFTEQQIQHPAAKPCGVRSYHYSAIKGSKIKRFLWLANSLLSLHIMAYRKLSADYIFNGKKFLQGDHVLIVNEAGIIQDIVSTKDAGADVQTFRGMLCPGFINAHCHLELSHMKGLIPEKTGLVDFVFDIVTKRHFSIEEIADAIEKAEEEMIHNGIVAVGDICNNISTLHQKTKQRLAYYNFVEVSGWFPPVAQTRFEHSKNFYDQFTTQHSPFTSLVPHAPYSVSDELWNYIQPFFPGKTITIHNQETAFENELFQNNAGDFIRMYNIMKIDNSHFTATGKTSLQSYFQRMVAAKNTILVHNTFTSEEDVQFVNRESSIVNETLQTFFCICINANLYIENKIPPVELFRKNNCNIVIGTDSLASNHSLSVLDELKMISWHFPEIPTEELLQWSTINGAKALQMENKLGSFEKGKQPGIILIENLNEKNISAEIFVTRIL